ncbi:uncharacterized protein I206_106996 [Kwoniella pini CBS 10737]|uniref:Uncharacterized protein n=1 Tax=Kwoniella pini CBS 10737 TaxID=1296096 RepID=A0A1B9HZM4_9TREE|nr:uncharacterized protein I206_05461 [Kwoniella pini CBS 10737]OCF48681.1 hypothetical protein I206_05461 [Kwoniella pini CBS 10737]
MTSSISRQIVRRDQSTSNSASASSTSFSISDTSPLFSYGIADSSSSSSSWTAGYAKQSDGYDETLHLSSASNSTISFNITASSLTLLIPSYDNCQATISINASSPILACSQSISSSSSEVIPFTLYNLPTGLHNVKWDSGTVSNGQQVIFWGIDGTRPIVSNGYSNITIDDSFNTVDNVNVGLKYEGDWTHLNPNAHSDALSESGNLEDDLNKTLAITKTTGSAVTLMGSGSAVYIYGTVGPDYGLASISLNGQIVVASLNLTSPWYMPYELLWFQTGLDSSQTSQVVMTNLVDKKMALDFVIVTTDSETLSQLIAGGSDEFLSSLKGKLILGVAIPVTVLLLLALLTIWIFRTRRQGKRRRNSRESQANLRPAFNGGTSPSSNKEKGIINARSVTPRSIASFDDVFVSYDEALQQRLSERWRSPTSPSNTNTTRSPRSPKSIDGTRTNTSGHTGIGLAMGLTNVPENMISSPERVRSLLGSQYAASTSAPDSRRGTALPAYTPEGTYASQFTPVTGGQNNHSPITAYETLTGTTPTNTNPSNPIPSTNSTRSTPPRGQNENVGRFPNAAEEKAAQLAVFNKFEKDGNGRNTTTATLMQPEAGPCSINRNSDTPSDLMSVFGTAPGSEGRLSTFTDWTAITPTTINQSPFLFESNNEIDNYPLPINQTPPLKISNSPNNNAKLQSTTNNFNKDYPIRPKVDMTFLNSPFKNKSTLNHPFSSSSSSTSRIPPPSSYPISAVPQTPSNISDNEYSENIIKNQRHGRNHSTSSEWTTKSAARPDSAIIPFENFFSGIQRAPTRE